MRIAVVGMHRSGTSAVAGLLVKLGFWAGAEGDLIPAKPDNPKGFVEREDLRRLNDALLAAAGETWETPASEAAAQRSPGTEAEIGEKLGRLRDVLERQPNWLVKDPRLSLTWDRACELTDQVVPVVAHRDPAEVAESLRVRDGFPWMLGVALWEVYYRRLAASAAAADPIVVSYRDLIEEPARTLSSLVSALADRGWEAGAAGANSARAVAWLDPKLRRATAPAAELGLLNRARRDLLAALESGRLPPPGVAVSTDAADVIELHRRHLTAVRAWEERLRESEVARHAMWQEKNASAESLEIELRSAQQQLHQMWCLKNEGLEELDRLRLLNAQLLAQLERARR